MRNLISVIFAINISTVVLHAQAPTAAFSVSVTSGCSPLIVQFENQSTGSNLTYEWSFGNGNQSSLAEPGAIYANGGSFDVRLKVTDDQGRSDQLTQSNLINVFQPPKVVRRLDLLRCV